MKYPSYVAHMRESQLSPVSLASLGIAVQTKNNSRLESLFALSADRQHGATATYGRLWGWPVPRLFERVAVGERRYYVLFPRFGAAPLEDSLDAIVVLFCMFVYWSTA